MKKSSKFILIILIIIYTVATVVKASSVQNDTFFDITIGNYIMENGIDMMDHWTWHSDLTYTYSHWLYSCIIAIIYNVFNFEGIYGFVLIMSCIIALTIFVLLQKKGHSTGISFVITLFVIYLARTGLTGRTQIVTYWLFILEYYFIGELAKKGQKRYTIILTIISIAIANLHASLWILSIVFYLPFIAENIIYKLAKNYKLKNEDSRIIIEEYNLKALIITMLLAIVGGLITPIGFVPFTFMWKNISGLSSDYIQELQSMQLIEWPYAIFLLSIFVGLIFTKTKYKLVDIIFFIGLFLMSLSKIRSSYYWFFISAFIVANLLKDCFEKYDVSKMQIKSKVTKACIVIFVLELSVANYYMANLNGDAYYFNEENYPIEICKYIVNNIDMENMKIFNQFDYGSYLEFCGIPAFMDSRSEVYCEEFNDTSILQDVSDCENGKITYEELFDKYEITHVLIYNFGTLYTYISQDENYELLCEEENFAFYSRNT